MVRRAVVGAAVGAAVDAAVGAAVAAALGAVVAALLLHAARKAAPPLAWPGYSEARAMACRLWALRAQAVLQRRQAEARQVD